MTNAMSDVFSMKRRLRGLFAILALAGCAGSTAVPVVSGSTTGVPTTTSVDSPGEGVSNGAFPGTLSLEECAWITPGKIEFRIAWEPDPDAEPVSAELGLVIPIGDSGFGREVSVVLDEATTLNEVVDFFQQSQQANPRHPAGYRSEGMATRGNTCAIADSANGFHDAGKTTLDPSFPDVDDLLFPLIVFEEQGGYELLNELAIVSDHRLDSINYRQSDTCTMVESSYDNDPQGLPSLRTTQSYGCSDEVAGERSPSGAWNLAVSPNQLVTVEWLILDGPAPEPGDVTYSPDAALDAGLESAADSYEVGRFDWEGGRASVQRFGDPFDVRAEPLIVIEPPIDSQTYGGWGGYQAVVCREYTLIEHQLGNPTEVGFAVLISNRRDIGLPFAIEMQPSTVEGLFIGFVDFQSDSYVSGGEMWSPVLADGSPVPCTQE